MSLPPPDGRDRLSKYRDVYLAILQARVKLNCDDVILSGYDGEPIVTFVDTRTSVCPAATTTYGRCSNRQNVYALRLHMDIDMYILIRFNRYS